MFKSFDIVHLKPYHFNSVSFILGIGYGLHFNCLVIFLKLVINPLCLFLVCVVQNMGLPILGHLKKEPPIELNVLTL